MTETATTAAAETTTATTSTSNQVNSLVSEFLERLKEIDLTAFVKMAKAVKTVFEKKIAAGGVTLPASTGSISDEIPAANATLADVKLTTTPISQEQLDELDKAISSGRIDARTLEYVKGLFTGVMLAS